MKATNELHALYAAAATGNAETLLAQLSERYPSSINISHWIGADKPSELEAYHCLWDFPTRLPSQQYAGIVKKLSESQPGEMQNLGPISVIQTPDNVETCQWLIFYDQAAPNSQQPFAISDQDQDFAQHFVRAWWVMQTCYNRLHALVPSDHDHDAVGSAVVLHSGQIESCNQQFSDLVKTRSGSSGAKFLPFQPMDQLRQKDECHFVEGDLFYRVKRHFGVLHIRVRTNLRGSRLSDREFEIAAKLAQGMTFKQIGEALHLAPSTVSTHVYSAYGKLSISSRAELVSWVQKRVHAKEN